jgi:hypothetical protein
VMMVNMTSDLPCTIRMKHFILACVTISDVGVFMACCSWNVSAVMKHSLTPMTTLSSQVLVRKTYRRWQSCVWMLAALLTTEALWNGFMSYHMAIMGMNIGSFHCIS